MTKQYCDRCGTDITGNTSGHFSGVADADEAGNGEVTHEFDLCPSCYDKAVAFMSTGRARTYRRARA